MDEPKNKIVHWHFDSANRSSGTNENYTIDYPGDRLPFNPKKAKIIGACIPYTWYNILTGVNDTMNFDDNGNPYVITIAPGYYSGIGLAEALTAAFVAAGIPLYTASFSASTLKFTFRNTGVLTPFSIFFPVGGNTLAERLGFLEGVVYNSAANVITSPNMADLLVSCELYITSNLIEGIDNGVNIITDGTAINNKIMAVVHTGSCFGSLITYCGCGDHPFFVVTQSLLSAIKNSGDSAIRQISLGLEFPSGFPLDLNGKSWSCDIVFTC